MRDLVNGSGFNGDQLVSFTYSMKQIYKYKEMKLSFGANVNIGVFFDLGVDVNSENTSFASTMMVDFVQTNFDIAMDMPEDGNIYLTEAIRNKFRAQKPIYINSIQYGRRGIILARSNESYSKFSAAVRAVFSIGAADINANLSVDQLNILKNADIQICIIGGKGEDVTATIDGFENFKEFIKKGCKYTNTTYGVPISYSAVYADTNELYVSKVNM
nr:thiol-activated cytolysin family protein [Myroides odoratimimus]